MKVSFFLVSLNSPLTLVCSFREAIRSRNPREQAQGSEVGVMRVLASMLGLAALRPIQVSRASS